jgi:hypothetical protein
VTTTHPNPRQTAAADVMVMADDDLVRELRRVEHNIASVTGFSCQTDPTGAVRVRVSDDLLNLAEREHEVSTELCRRRSAQPDTYRLPVISSTDARPKTV